MKVKRKFKQIYVEFDGYYSCEKSQEVMARVINYLARTFELERILYDGKQVKLYLKTQDSSEPIEVKVHENMQWFQVSVPAIDSSDNLDSITSNLEKIIIGESSRTEK